MKSISISISKPKFLPDWKAVICDWKRLKKTAITLSLCSRRVEIVFITRFLNDSFASLITFYPNSKWSRSTKWKRKIYYEKFLVGDFNYYSRRVEWLNATEENGTKRSEFESESRRKSLKVQRFLTQSHRRERKHLILAWVKQQEVEQRVFTCEKRSGEKWAFTQTPMAARRVNKCQDEGIVKLNSKNHQCKLNTWHAVVNGVSCNRRKNFFYCLRMSFPSKLRLTRNFYLSINFSRSENGKVLCNMLQWRSKVSQSRKIFFIDFHCFLVN